MGSNSATNLVPSRIAGRTTNRARYYWAQGEAIPLNSQMMMPWGVIIYLLIFEFDISWYLD